MINKINVKRKSISTFDCSALYATILHKLLLKVPSEVINFFFKSKVSKCIGFSKISVYWTSKGAGRGYFTKQTLVNAISFLINKCFITLLVKWFLNKILVYQLVPFWINFFLYFFESKYVKRLISNGSSKALTFVL